MNVISMRRPQLAFLGGLILIVALVLYVLPGRHNDHRHTTTGESKGEVNQWHRQRHSFNGSQRQLDARSSNSKPSMSDLSPAWSLKPDFVNTFGGARTNSSTTGPFISHIIHQVWDTTQIPDIFVKWIPTWLARNPDWQHWLWTLDDVRDLVARHYPDHLTLYDSYSAPIFRADVMRYFVLHRYGGVYVDLDMESLRPLEDWTTHFHCLVSEENYEHSFVIREQTSTNLINGFIACAPRHPFLKKAIESLDDAAMKYFGDYIYATGPKFFDAVWNGYADQLRGLTVEPADRVTVLPPYYFLPTYDPSESDLISGKCSPSSLRSLPPKSQIVCRELARRSFHNTVHPQAYANHYWIHAYMYGEEWKTINVRSVFDFAPKVQAAYVAVKHLEGAT